MAADSKRSPFPQPSSSQDDIPHSPFPTPHSPLRLPPSAFADRLDIFSGAATPAEARIYARLELTREEANAGYQLTGRVVGPECAFSHTLPARMPMMNRSTDNTLLLEAVVPDPCFWTPELPFLYRAQLELQCNNETNAKSQRTIGIRRLGVRDRSLNFDGKRFVLRAIHLKSQISDSKFQISDLKSQIKENAAFLRDTWTALVVPNQSDELCDFASRHGILLLADLTEAQNPGCHGQAKSARAEAERELISELRLLAQWPAVAVAIVSSNEDLPADIHETARNLLLAQCIAADQPLRLAKWAQIAIVEVKQPKALADKIEGCNLPIMAYQPRAGLADVESDRADCDKLQGDLASYGDFAGYVV